MDYLLGVPAHPTMRDIDYGFYGENWNSCLNSLIRGNTKNLAKAEKLIQEMQDANIFTENLPIMQHSMVGAVPNIPAAIIGHPKSMFMRKASEMENTSTPLTIYVETTVSAGVTTNELVNRGIACLAFVLAMSAIRPIELIAVSAGLPGGQTTIIDVKIPTNPIDLARATWMLTSNDYARRINFVGFCDMSGHITYEPRIGWAWQSTPTSPTYQTNMRRILNMSDKDVLIAGGHLHDKLMLTDPITWVKDMIAKHNTTDDHAGDNT